jgi:RNA polymerase sigma-70 factor, ECF subfamily
VVQQARDDPSLFTPLYHRYRDRIYWYLRARVASEEDAADLTQQVFLQAFERLHQYRERKGSFAAWLFAIARHAASNSHRRPRPVDWDYLPPAQHATERDTTEADVMQRQSVTRVTQLIGALPVQKRELIVLRFVGELTNAEIAAIIGKSPTPVSAQTILRRAETAGLVPNHITHFVYQIASSTGFTGTSQFWVQADANGAPERVAFDGTGPDSVAIPRHLVAAYEVHVGQNLPASLVGSQVAGQQTLDGVPVDVVQEPSGAVLYFDAQSYIVRGADWSTDKDGTSSPSSWRARLLQYGTVPASAAPAGPWHGHGLPRTSGATKPGSP